MGRDKRRRKFSRTGERAPGMLLLPNQFHNSIEYLSLIGETEASIYRAAFMIFLYEGVYLQTRLKTYAANSIGSPRMSQVCPQRKQMVP